MAAYSSMDPINCATTIGKYLLNTLGWPFLQQHVDYWWHFDDNIQQLTDGIRDLDRQIEDVRQRIEGARLRTENLRSGVEDWANKGTSKLEKARIILPDDNIPKAWNLISRYSMGKSARKTTEEIAKHQKDGNFGTISDPAPPPSMGSISQRQIMDFESRKRIEEEIMESLRNNSISTIAICGMGGVGKTSMVEKISKRVREENLFDEVPKVVVSQQVDMLKLQKEIAEWLGLAFNVETMSARAHQLRTRLMDIKRKIIIFDDVWESLKFEDLGIPFNFERCKILLTSRSTGICEGIRNKKVYEMDILEEGEAWNLFKENAGNCIEDPNLHPLAEKVVAECKGLPIALVTVGKALEDEKSKHKWKFAISQLNNPTDFPEVMTRVYNPLKLSYDFLDNDNERLLFLLCCLFPEDYNISVEQLTWYIMGLGIFDGIDSIEEARNRTHVMVGNLKKRSLLIDGRNELYVKMHDVIRDVAIYIGSKEKKGFLKSLKNSLKENSSDANCVWVSADISNKPMEVPVGWHFPNLRLLMLLEFGYEEFSNIFFEGMEGLNVLSFSSTSISSLPPTLTNLQTLSLFDCGVQEISIIGELTSLEILSFDGCPDIMELPEEIGKLTRLRLLRLHRCTNLETITFGIISRLVRLEELKVVSSFRRWEATETRKARRNAALSELESLSNLTCLEIEIDDWNLASENIRLSQNLVKCRITINSSDYSIQERGYEKVMNLNLPGNIGVVGNWIQMLVKNTEFLYLEGNGSNNFDIAELENLRKLILSFCSTMEELLIKIDRTNLNQDVSLRYLESIELTHCSNLRFLFSVSVARTSLLQLKVLEIGFCEKLEQVFWNEIRDDRDACIQLPKLKTLRLICLENLTAFCHGLENIIKFPNLKKMRINYLPKLKTLPCLNSEARHDDTTSHHFLFQEKVEVGNLKKLFLGGLDYNIKNIWCSQISIDFFNNLEELRISHLNGIRSLMSYSIAKNLVSLKYLGIAFCEEIIEVIEGDDDEQAIDIQYLFPALKELVIEDLPTLRRFWKWNGALELSLLESVDISHCSVMETFTLGSLNTPNIRRIIINKTELQNEKDLNHAMSL